ncbi:hypothetical protein TNCV_367991 [Trichonephila clavipes]|nr:hypothetical protein TNCV_367991 [Trichonephila clavipes]
MIDVIFGANWEASFATLKIHAPQVTSRKSTTDGSVTAGSSAARAVKSVSWRVSSEMEVTRVQQHAYIKIAILRGKNVMEYHSELVEALGGIMPYHTVQYHGGWESFNKDVCQSVMSNVVQQMLRLMVFSASHIVVITVAGDYIEGP